MQDTREAASGRLFSCPRDGAALVDEGGSLRCGHGHRYPVVEGIPVLLRPDVPGTIGLIAESLAAENHPEDGPLYLRSVGISDAERDQARALAAGSHPIDPVVSVLVGATSGHAYKHLIGKLHEYPIPEIRLPPGDGKTLIDIGCSWGRWSMAAARKGYRVTGIDPSLGALLAAKRASRQLGLDIAFVCADARYLPFPADTFDVAYSYSVLQHFSIEDALRAIEEVGRVLKPGGMSLVQMAHHGGPLSLYHQLRRGSRQASGFDVRYWRLAQLRDAFAARVGASAIEAHCFFGLGLERSDARLMKPAVRALTALSDFLASASRRMDGLVAAADSVYIRSVKSGSPKEER